MSLSQSCRGCSISQSSMLAKKLRSVVKDNRLKTLDIEVSVSTGVAANESHESLQDVIVRADEDLYEMKKTQTTITVSNSFIDKNAK